MRWSSCLALWTTVCATAVVAIHQHEVGVVDWHKPLIGVPLIDWTTTAPVFHRVSTATGAEESVVLAATGSNVLAALNPSNGSIVWRYNFAGPVDQVIAFQRHESIVAALSGPGGATLRLFDTLHGHLMLEKRFHAPEAGNLEQPNRGVSIAFAGDGEEADMLVLTNSHEVRRLKRSNGELVWAWQSSDQTSLVLYTKLIPTASATYVVGLAKSIAGITLHVAALSPSTGELLAEVAVPSKLQDGTTDLLVLASGDEPRVVWIEGNTIKSIALSPSLVGKVSSIRGTYDRIIDVGLATQAMFVGVKQDGTGRVITLDAAAGVLKATHEFAESVKSESYSESMYTGSVDKSGNPYVTRLYWSHVHKAAQAQIYGAHLAEGKSAVIGYSFPFDTNQHGIFIHVAVDIANPEDLTVLARLVITTTTGTVQLWANTAPGVEVAMSDKKAEWTREESLAYITVAEFVDLPERMVAAAGHTGAESFLQRVLRQAKDAQNFPSYLRDFTTRFATGSYASATGPAKTSSMANGTTAALERDAFGFHKILVVATPYGKILALDGITGEVVWSRMFDLGPAREVGATIFPVKLFTLKDASEGANPEVALVTLRRANNGLMDTVLFYFDALTGDSALPGKKGKEDRTLLMEGSDTVQAGLLETFLVTTDKEKFVVMIDEHQQVHRFPDNPWTLNAMTDNAASLYFTLRAGMPGNRKLVGHRVMTEPDHIGKYLAYPAWTLSLPAGEEIRSVQTVPRAPVASLGKVLGNRTTLYKYLSPRLTAMITSSTRPSAGCGVYVLDAGKGTVLYHARVPSAAQGEACDVKIAMAENWIVYHHYDANSDGDGSTKGHRLVSVEIYEGIADQKQRSSDASAYSPDTASVAVYEQSYIYAHDITALAMTSTKFGITSKDLIVANENDQIQSFPRRILDPRRPKRKVTAEEQEELLMQYDALIPDDPRRVISHTYQVAQTKKIVMSPALLESTSVVFAHGLDLFLTRVAPSNTFDVLSESFNKAQLVLTILGLAAAIAVTKPMVKRKQLRERWHA